MLAFSVLVILGILLTGSVFSFIAAGIEARNNHSGYGVVGYFRCFYSAFSVIFVAIALFATCRGEIGFNCKYFPFLLCVLTLGMIAIISNGGRRALYGCSLTHSFSYIYWIKLKLHL